MTPEDIRALRADLRSSRAALQRDIAKRQLRMGQEPVLIFSEPTVRRSVPAVVTKTTYNAHVENDEGLITNSEKLIVELMADEITKLRIDQCREVSRLRRRVRELERRLSRLEERSMIVDLPALPAR